MLSNFKPQTRDILIGSRSLIQPKASHLLPINLNFVKEHYTKYIAIFLAGTQMPALSLFHVSQNKFNACSVFVCQDTLQQYQLGNKTGMAETASRARSASFSSANAPSAGSTKDLEKYVKYLFYKASQIVVQSRQVSVSLTISKPNQ